MANYTCDDTEPQCECCGEAPVSVSTTHAGLCDGCMAAEVQIAMEPLMGKVCGAVRRTENGHISVCLAPYGVEHLHN